MENPSYKTWFSEFKTFFFGTPDRIIGTSSFVASSTGIILFIIQTYPDEFYPEIIVIRDSSIFIGLLLAFLFVLVLYCKREYFYKETIRQKNEAFEKTVRQKNEAINNFHDQCEHAHKLVHLFRDSVFRYYIDIGIFPEDVKVEHTDEKRLFDKVCGEITYGLKIIFENHFSAKGWDFTGNVAITVKITMSPKNILEIYSRNFTPEKQEVIRKKSEWVITAFRDPDTYHSAKEREIATTIYDIGKNTAFKKILIDKDDRFCSNNLEGLRDYDNENEARSYNATIVVPIRYHREESGEYWYFGLLTADSKNKLDPDTREVYNLYENEESFNIISHAADLLALFFLALGLKQSENE